MPGGVRQLGYRAQQVLDYIAARLERDGAPPSYGMIADALGFATTQDVRAVIQRLERRGYLHRRSVGVRRNRGWHRPVIVLATHTTRALRIR